MSITKMTNKNLRKNFLEYDDLIHGNYQCYGIKDLLFLNNLESEILRRGGEIVSERRIVFEKNVKFNKLK